MSDKLQEIFLAEAHELIIDLEKALLVLDKDFQDHNAIGAVFRAMHTLKGSAGMFGFQSVGKITHHLENIFQDIRESKRQLNNSILDITFKTLDHLRELMNDPQLERQELKVTHHELLTAIAKLELSANQSEKQEVGSKTKNEEQSTYYVSILPNPHMLRNGTNALYLIDDLLTLGSGVSFPFFHSLPELRSIVPTDSHMGFEILLGTNKSETEIQEVFIFVESECDLTIKKLSIGDYQSLAKQLPKTKLAPAAPYGFHYFYNLLAPKPDKKEKNPSSQTKANGASSIRVKSDQLDDLMNMVSELVTTQARLALFASNNTSQELENISENIEKITRRLRDNAFTMSLVPLENIITRFQRLVNDLSRELNKEIDFKAEGTDTEIDKSIIEKLTDPLLHILRNSIDHGIESPETRLHNGKAKRGLIQLKSYYSGANVIIEVSDDGAGINLEKVRENAVKKGLIDGHAQPDERELLELIFIPGFSTAKEVTGVSGRGVGMDVVKRNISDIRGEIIVNTQKGKGSTFTIKLPLTLSILDGLLVKIGDTDFILPLSSVVKCYEVPTQQLESSYNQWITLEGKRTPFLLLRNEFGITDNSPELSQIINVPFYGGHVGLVVDKIIGEYQSVLKPLGHCYQDNDEISGATILGNGTVALVLDPNKLIRKLTNDIKLKSYE